jgi:hypothetical protein
MRQVVGDAMRAQECGADGAVTAPARVGAQHQSLLHLVGEEASQAGIWVMTND